MRDFAPYGTENLTVVGWLGTYGARLKREGLKLEQQPIIPANL
jgi:hypothetical protein